MATYTRDKTNKKPVFGGGVPSTTQELAKSVAQKEVANKPQMAQGQPKSPLAGAAGNMQSIANKGPIPAGTQLDQTGVKAMGGSGGDITPDNYFNYLNRAPNLELATSDFSGRPILGGRPPIAGDRVRDAAGALPESDAAREARERREELERLQKLWADEEAQNKDLDGDRYIGDPSIKANKITEEEAIDRALSDLLYEDLDVSKEREAMIGEMEAKEARDIQSMRARTGLGGMGLTGAAGALESQVRQETGREQALTTAQFDRAAREEALNRLLTGIKGRRGEQVYSAEMEMYEMEADLDINEDGFIGGKRVGGKIGDRDPTNNEETVDNSRQGKVDRARDVADQPPGSTLFFSGSGYNYYEDAEGNTYKVRVRTASEIPQ